MLGDFWNNFILQTLNHIAWYFPCLYIYARFNCSCFNSGCFNDNFQLLLKVSCQINQSLTQGIKAASFSIVFISRLDLKLCFFGHSSKFGKCLFPVVQRQGLRRVGIIANCKQIIIPPGKHWHSSTLFT